MAAKEISVKKYVVRLSGEEREQLEALIRKGKSAAQRLLKARILLKADVSEAGEGWSDNRIIKALRPAPRWFTGSGSNWWRKASRLYDPALLAMGLENVFFSARPIVESLARSTICSSTTFFSNSRKVQRARPLGGLEQASAINLASFSPAKIRATAGVARCLRLNTASKPSSTSCFRTR